MAEAATGSAAPELKSPPPPPAVANAEAVGQRANETEGATKTSLGQEFAAAELSQNDKAVPGNEDPDFEPGDSSDKESDEDDTEEEQVDELDREISSTDTSHESTDEDEGEEEDPTATFGSHFLLDGEDLDRHLGQNFDFEQGFGADLLWNEDDEKAVAAAIKEENLFDDEDFKSVKEEPSLKKRRQPRKKRSPTPDSGGDSSDDEDRDGEEEEDYESDDEEDSEESDYNGEEKRSRLGKKKKSGQKKSRKKPDYWDAEIEFVCHDCGAKTVGFAEAVDHMREVHPADPDSPQQFECILCGRQFGRRDHLKRHVKGHMDGRIGDGKRNTRRRKNTSELRPYSQRDWSLRQVFRYNCLP